MVDKVKVVGNFAYSKIVVDKVDLVDSEVKALAVADSEADLIIADRALDTVIIIARAFMAVGDGDPVFTDTVVADALAAAGDEGRGKLR